MKRQLVAVVLALLVSPAIARAQDPLFTDRVFVCFQSDSPSTAISGFTGVAGYENCIDATSVSYGVSNITSIGSSSGGAGAGKAKLSDFTFTKLVDRASPALLRAAVLGQHFEQVKVSFVRIPTKKGLLSETLRLVLKLAFVTKIDTSGAPGTPASENVTLTFGALALEVGDAAQCFDTVSNSQGGLCQES